MTHPSTDSEYVTASYRYLRLAMVIVVATLGISLLIEIWGAGCLLGSVSAYYYTPVHAVFIGSLLAIGVAMVALKGRDTIEDLALNLAGVLAPMVAFVPTGRPSSACLARADELVVSHSALVANNVVSLLAGAALAIVVAYVVARRQHKVGELRPSPAAWIGMALSAAALLAGVIWYVAGRDSFEERAHGVAAALMFVAFWVAVLVNAGWPAGPLRFAYRWLATPVPDPLGASPAYRAWYRWIALAMAAFAIIALASLLIEWDHRVFWLEAAEILAFGTFWTLQTLEAWRTGQAAEAKAAPTAAA